MDQTTTTRPGVHAGTANAIGAAFYIVVALIALAGQTIAAAIWLGWPVVFALPATAALELGGIALAAHADVRRRLGERAHAARLLSAAVAGFAVVFNWVGHTDHRQGAFFAGMSALGYTVWLINAGARRRDQMRADGNLPPIPPAYGLWHWVRHPWMTRRARALAQADPGLGLYGSLTAARTQRRTEQRQAAIAEALRRKLTAAVDPLTAQIATATFDLDEIAARLAATADYDGLTALIATDLTPAKLTSDRPTRTTLRGGDAATVTPAGTGTKARRHTGTRTARPAGTRTDADLIAALAHVPREADGTVPVRRAAAALGTGPDRARRLLTDAGLLRTIPPVPVAGRPSLPTAA